MKENKKLFILTFDLEEWFHILDIDDLESQEKWDQFEVRIFNNTYRILELLDRHGLKATFFILGWAAKRYPELVRAIFEHYADKPSLVDTAQELNRRGWKRKSWTTRDGNRRYARPWDRKTLYKQSQDLSRRSRPG